MQNILKFLSRLRAYLTGSFQLLLEFFAVIQEDVLKQKYSDDISLKCVIFCKKS